jgi:lipid-A-disaccharide synthase
MCSVVKHFNNYQFVIAGAPSINEKVYEKYLNNNVKIVYNDTYNLLNNSKVALVTSGTATLETALFRVPEVVCYKGSEISYQIAKRLIKVKYISLVNLIMNKEVVKELIQNDLTEKKLVQELSRIIDDSKERQDILSDYNKLEKVLGGVGASERAAHEILLLK